MDTTGRSSGLTLMELMVSLVFLSVLLVVAVAGVIDARTMHDVTDRGARQTQQRVQLSSDLRSSLSQASLKALPAEGDYIEYYLPVSDTATGKHVDEAGKPLWGASDSGGDRIGGWYRIEFVLNRVRSEQLEQNDINDDGDLDDSFDEGTLMRTTETGEIIAMPTPYVLLVTGDHAGDVDGDDVGDPIFTVRTNGALSITMITQEQSGRLKRHRYGVLLANV